MSNKHHAICALLLAAAAGRAGADYFPLSEGVVYEYEYSIRQPSGWYLTGTYVTYFSGTTDVGGTITRVLHYAGDGHDGLLHFWSQTPEGDKYFHGSYIPSGGYYFSPPILMIDEPVFVGKTWVVDSRASDSLAVRIHFEVTAFGEVTVPAGTFQAFTIEDTWEFPEGMRGRKVYTRFWGDQDVAAAVPYMSRRTYADGVGQLFEVFGGRTERLLAVRTIGVQPTTWTGIRLLYR